jgi:erythromycin esterase-like protein
MKDDHDLDLLMSDIGRARIVLLGESSHGMSEFYTWRASITKKLIEEKGFNLIALEGDFTEIEHIDSFVSSNKSDSATSADVLKRITRWPAWLWSNQEFVPFISWLNEYNQQARVPVHICGLDLFSISASAEALTNYPEEMQLHLAATSMLQCFSRYDHDALKYAGRFEKLGSCGADAEKLFEAAGRAHPFSLQQWKLMQHASVVLHGEQYFQKLASQRVAAWNIRDNHMFQTIKKFMQSAGPHAKLVVWAHNTHVGDAHYSYMTMQGKTNIGELLRKEFGGENVFITGFGSYRGTVTTSDAWGGQAVTVAVPPSQKGSWEEMLHHIRTGSLYIRCYNLRNDVSLLKWIPQRALGAVYQASKDSQVYVPSVIPWRYDAFIFIDETHALHPLKQGETVGQGIPIDD